MSVRSRASRKGVARDQDRKYTSTGQLVPAFQTDWKRNYLMGYINRIESKESGETADAK
jgi:hypothetical protein